MRVLVEVTQATDQENEEGETIYEKSEYWLLYFGLDYKIIELGEGRVAAVNYTIAICEDYETREIRCFLPEQLKILGKEIKT